MPILKQALETYLSMNNLSAIKVNQDTIHRATIRPIKATNTNLINYPCQYEHLLFIKL